MGIPRGFSYSDQEVSCPMCGRSFKNQQGLHGHMKWVHGENSLPAGKTKTRNQHTDERDQEISELRQENTRLKLLKEHQSLSGFNPQKPQATDMASASGLGDLDPDVKRELQARALNLDGNKPESWLTLLLRNPEGIRVLADALKGILGVPQNGGQDQLGSVLKLFGCESLLELSEKLAGPKAPQGLKLGGIDLSGVNLTPEVFSAVLAYQANQEKILSDKEKSKMLAQGIETIAKIVGNQDFISKFKGSNGISHQKQADDRFVFCPACNYPIPLSEAQPDGKIFCPSCKSELAVDDLEEPEFPKAKSKAPKTPPSPPPELLRCPQCNQVLNTTGLAEGEKFECSNCGLALRVEDVETPKKPILPSGEAENPRGRLT